MASGTSEHVGKVRFWEKRGFKIAVGLVTLLAASVVGYWKYRQWVRDAAWQAAMAEAARDVPRWRILELHEDIPEVPAEQNSALVIAQTVITGRYDRQYYDYLEDLVSPPYRLHKKQAEIVNKHLEQVAPNLPRLRDLKHMPYGKYPIIEAQLPAFILDSQANARVVASWLLDDAIRLTYEGRIGEALDACHAMLHVSRSLDRDLFLISVSVRSSLDESTRQTLEYILSQGEAREDALADLQNSLLDKTVEGHFLLALRGDRAIFHYAVDELRAGRNVDKILSIYFPDVPRGRRYSIQIIDDLYNYINYSLTPLRVSSLLDAYPEAMHLYNQLVDIAKLPTHERNVRVKQVMSGKDSTWPGPVIPIRCDAISAWDCVGLASRRCSAAALACERYRLRYGQWPDSLRTLVAEGLLPDVPLDPFDGQELRMRRTEYGVVIYSVGENLVDDGGQPDSVGPYVGRQRGKAPVDVGIRLWDREKRRQPPKPLMDPYTGEVILDNAPPGSTAPTGAQDPVNQHSGKSTAPNK